MESVFDTDEYSSAPDEEETTDAEDSADEIVAQLTDEVVEEEGAPDDSYLLEVDKRLEVATYYRSLLRNPLFDQVTPASEIVEREHKRFIRERLEVLMSIRPAAPAPVVVAKSEFTPEEVTAIKVLIGQMRKKGMIAAAEPTPVAATPAPVAPPAPRRTANPAPRPAPTVAPARTPAPVPAQAATPPAQPATRPTAQKAKPGKPATKKETPALTKKVIAQNPDDPEQVREITVQRIQRPSGAIPFPSSNQAMEAATHRAAMVQASSGMTSSGMQGTSTQTLGRAPLAAVAAAIIKNQ